MKIIQRLFTGVKQIRRVPPQKLCSEEELYEVTEDETEHTYLLNIPCTLKMKRNPVSRLFSSKKKGKNTKSLENPKMRVMQYRRLSPQKLCSEEELYEVTEVETEHRSIQYEEECNMGEHQSPHNMIVLEDTHEEKQTKRRDQGDWQENVLEGLNHNKAHFELVIVRDRGTSPCHFPPEAKEVHDKAIQVIFPEECYLPSCERERDKLKKDIKERERSDSILLAEGALLLDDIEKIKKHVPNIGKLPDVFYTYRNQRMETPIDYHHLSRTCLMELGKYLQSTHKQMDNDRKIMKIRLNTLKEETNELVAKINSIERKLDAQITKVKKHSKESLQLQLTKLNVHENDNESWDYTALPEFQKNNNESWDYTALPEFQKNNNESWDYTALPEFQKNNNESWDYTALPVMKEEQPTVIRGDTMHHGPPALQGHGYRPPKATQSSRGCVMMVSGLDEERVNPDKLFNIFCLYGNVLKIKLLKTKKGCALIQMGDTISVERCISNLNNLSVGDMTIQLGFSNHASVSHVSRPYSLPGKSLSFKDFEGNRNNRFINPKMASKNRIQGPSKVLHFFSTPRSVSEDTLNKIFQDKCNLKPRVHWFHNKGARCSSGLLEFDSIEKASFALMICNHALIEHPDGGYPYVMRLNFCHRNNLHFI